ncbi:hypothetical protein J7M22_08115 [Candidatus Poribacteria bacterium]|nr:hypothetical protein [Candidatus Poribacteria bacterium]
MKIQQGIMVALGYGKYFRSDSIVGLEPIEEGRGAGKRTKVYIEGHTEPIIASRTESTILRDLIEAPKEITRAREHMELLRDILENIASIPPMLRSIIRDQGGWDLDRLEERIKEALEIKGGENDEAISPIH